MAKFKFGPPPKDFTRTIQFQTLSGNKEEFDVTFNYRTRKEFGELFDEMVAAAKARGGASGPEEVSMSAVMDATSGDNSQYLLKALAGWDLDQELNEANAKRLANEFPAAANAIMEAYRAACLEGRLGN